MTLCVQGALRGCEVWGGVELRLGVAGRLYKPWEGLADKVAVRALAPEANKGFECELR